MSGHTPETWENPRFTAAPYSIWCGNTQIATTRWTQDDGSVSPECVQDDNEAKANASLISAAPLLLQELRGASTQMERAAECIEAGRYDEALLYVRSMSRSCRTAIAEATGEQP